MGMSVVIWEEEGEVCACSSLCPLTLSQVLSGDCVVIRGQPKGGPPPERTLALTNITAPKLARRPNPGEGKTESKDEVWIRQLKVHV